ncbi:MAG TPA: hypothetical protein VE078_12195, partial [Thermoanaerobaculia bacterium]|nr:hypothetical protein [Thermoanaerobaculia bacterium]
MKSKITSSLLNRLPFATAGKSYYVMDTELPGFALRVHATTIQFVVRYRKAPYVIGPARSHEGDNTPGRGGVFTVRQARERARDLLIDLWSGKALRRSRRGPSHPSIRNLFDEYFRQHAPKKRASSVKMDRVHWKKILSYFPGTLDVASLATTEIVRWHQQMADTPAAANRALGVLSKALNLAEVWGWIP